MSDKTCLTCDKHTKYPTTKTVTCHRRDQEASYPWTDCVCPDWAKKEDLADRITAAVNACLEAYCGMGLPNPYYLLRDSLGKIIREVIEKESKS